jgi:hypothetical protein
MAMPDDDAGREDLEVLVGYLVLAGKDPWHQLELLAPWCTEAAAARMIEVAQRFSDWHDDDQLAHLLRLRYETRLHLGITSIGAIDVDRAGRARLRRQRWNAKRRAQPEPKDLSCRQQAVLDEIGGDEVAVPALVERLKRNRAFRGIAAPSLRIIVHRVLDQLIAIGLIGDYYAPGQKGPVRNVQRVSNDRARRAEA